MSTALAIVPFDQVERMASAMSQSGLFGMKSADQALALMLVAQAEGQHPATIAQDYDIIQGRAARKTHSVLARFQAAGGKVEWHELTNTKADATFAHAAGGSLRMVWTIEQAQKAGLTGKDNWKNYPRAMLRARCIAEGVRAVYPGAIGGMLVAEEAQDLAPAAKHFGAAPEVTPPPELLAGASQAATRGVEHYAAWWKAATREQRAMIGLEQHNANKAQAEAADKARTVDTGENTDEVPS